MKTENEIPQDGIVSTNVESNETKKTTISETVATLFKEGKDAKQIIAETGFKKNTVYILLKKLKK
jgi:hypothetical protein